MQAISIFAQMRMRSRKNNFTFIVDEILSRNWIIKYVSRQGQTLITIVLSHVYMWFN